MKINYICIKNNEMFLITQCRDVELSTNKQLNSFIVGYFEQNYDIIKLGETYLGSVRIRSKLD